MSARKDITESEIRGQNARESFYEEFWEISAVIYARDSLGETLCWHKVGMLL